MHTKTIIRLIALKTTRYNDRYNILTAYTNSRGTMSFLLPAGNGREASRRRALLMPLSIVECVADTKPGRDISTMSEPRPVVVLQWLHSHPVKNALTQFIADLLTVLLRDMQAQGDNLLFEFLEKSIRTLDLLPPTGIANFHLVFLARLARMLGIAPDDGSYRRGYLLDMRDGIWRRTAPIHSQWLPSHESKLALLLMNTDYRRMSLLHMNRDTRRTAMELVLEYYGLHFRQMSSMHSPDVLKVLFD